MRISDWSSDVCSSDLERTPEAHSIAGLGFYIVNGARGIVIAVEHQRPRIDLPDQWALPGHIGAPEGAIGARLAQFQEAQAQFLDHARRRAKGLCRIAVIAALRFAIG